MELAQTALLGLLVAVAGGEIVELDGQAVVVDAVLEHGARRARGAFGAQGYGAASLVEEGVHFLLDDVGGVADAALEELRVLKDGSAHLAKAMQGGFAAHDGLDDLPLYGFLGKNVLGPARGLGDNCHNVSSFPLDPGVPGVCAVSVPPGPRGPVRREHG